MGQLAQFAFFVFNLGQTLFSQLHISLDPDELKCSLITAKPNWHVWAVINGSVPKYTLNISAIYTQICQIFVKYV